MSQHPQNKMGIMPVGKLLISMSLPAMFSMLIQALYNVVDNILCRTDRRRCTDRRFARISSSELSDCGQRRYLHRFKLPDFPPSWRTS